MSVLANVSLDFNVTPQFGQNQSSSLAPPREKLIRKYSCHSVTLNSKYIKIINNRMYSCFFYSIANWPVSLTAYSSLLFSTESVGYGGRSIRLKQVWARGRSDGLPHISIQNGFGPFGPRRPMKPS
mgnify:CR=1 FL=1